MVQQDQFEELRDSIADLVQTGLVDQAVSRLLELHPADQADIFEDLDNDVVEPLFAALSTDQKAELLEYLQDDLRGDLAGDLSATELAPVLDQMDEDVAADIVQDLEPEQQEAVVSLLEEREEIEGCSATRRTAPPAVCRPSSSLCAALDGRRGYRFPAERHRGRRPDLLPLRGRRRRAADRHRRPAQPDPASPDPPIAAIMTENFAASKR